jgi:hypothetical protein
MSVGSVVGYPRPVYLDEGRVSRCVVVLWDGTVTRRTMARAFLEKVDDYG